MLELSPTMTVDLLRHGESVGGKRYRGYLDDPLSELGWQQMWEAVGMKPLWQNIVTSPLARCREFAQALGRRDGITITVDERLKEVGFGDWEGRSPEELRRMDPDLVMRFYNAPDIYRPPQAEPLQDFYDRISQAWHEIWEQYKGTQVLLVGHAGTIRAVLCQILSIPLRNMYRIQVANAGFTRVYIDSEARSNLIFHGGKPS